MKGNRANTPRSPLPNATGPEGFNPRWLAAARALGYGDHPKALPAWQFVLWMRPMLEAYNLERLPNGHGAAGSGPAGSVIGRVCCTAKSVAHCELRPSLCDPPEQVTAWILARAAEQAEEFAPPA